MKPNLLMTIILPAFAACQQPTPSAGILQASSNTVQNPYAVIGDIPPPAGYLRTPAEKKSFPNWLRGIELKKEKTVYLYNGLPKTNQSAQFAVLNISVGHKDLQQCADAVMRLRAEYLYAQKKYATIDFRDNNNTSYVLGKITDRNHFDNYLDKVFSQCGTLSLEKQLEPVRDIDQLKPGDVLIQGGSPGHAMIVADMAADKSGKKIYLLAQSYMPAQDIHIVINPSNNGLSPWYELNAKAVYTPEWSFPKMRFKTWP
jgi:hypothetical protein